MKNNPVKCFHPTPHYHKWPASREKGPSDISHSEDQDQPQKDVEIARKIIAIDVMIVKKCRP